MRFYTLIFVICCFPLVAESSDFSFSYLPYVSVANIDDPDGNTTASTSFQPINFVSVITSERDTRYWFEVGMAEYAFDASSSEVGQDVKQTYLSASHQWRFRWGANFKPWLGVGITASQLDFSKRHILDNGGFLSQTFDDRETTGTALSLQAISDTEFDDYQLTYGLMVEQSISDSLSAFRFTFGMSF